MRSNTKATTERREQGMGTRVSREGAYYDDPGPEIHRRVKRLREADPELGYAEAMHRVFRNDPLLKEVYGALGGGGPEPEPDDRVEAGREVDRRARACMEDSGCDYSAAFHAVLGADPELKRRYARV